MTDKTDMPEGITRDETVHGETYFTAADMATASAQGFRDGVASLAASAGSEPVAIREAIAHFRLTHWADEDGGLGLADALSQLYGDDDIGRANEELDALADAISEIVTHHTPPEGMVMVPKVPTMAMRIAAKTADMDHTNLSDWMVSDWPEFNRIWDAMLKAAPPTSPADSRKGE